MSSAVDICNLALGHLGDDAAVSAISPPDGSVQAEHCARFYPIARDELLEQHNWNFALRRASLALLSTTEIPATWAFAYAYPTCLRVISVYPANVAVAAATGAIFESSDFSQIPPSIPFAVETLPSGAQVIYSNTDEATVLYLARVTDTAKFSTLFVIALSRLLASYLAGPILKGKEGRAETKAQLEIFEKLVGPRAKASDANIGSVGSYDNFVPTSLQARN